MTKVAVFPELTHNPWHPAYKLTTEGVVRAREQLIKEALSVMRREYPGQSVAVKIGDIVWAGLVVPNKG